MSKAHGGKRLLGFFWGGGTQYSLTSVFLAPYSTSFQSRLQSQHLGWWEDGEKQRTLKEHLSTIHK